MPSSDFKIRLAFEHEAYALTELANRSKSYWPHDEEYLKFCRSLTHVTGDAIRKWPFIVATLNGELCGFATICEVKGEKLLDQLWVDPPYIGRGLGRILFLEAVTKAKELGWSEFHIASDPFALGFYQKVGARQIGVRESKAQAGVFMPLLEFSFFAEGLLFKSELSK